jgi:hypothetical protein
MVLWWCATAEPLLHLEMDDPWDGLYPPSLMLLMDGPFHHRTAVAFPGVVSGQPRTTIAAGLNGLGTFPRFSAGTLLRLPRWILGVRVDGMDAHGSTDESVRPITRYDGKASSSTVGQERHNLAAGGEVWGYLPAGWLRGMSATIRWDRAVNREIKTTTFGDEEERESTEHYSTGLGFVIRAGLRLTPHLVARHALVIHRAGGTHTERGDRAKVYMSQHRRDTTGFSLGLVGTSRKPAATIVNAGFMYAQRSESVEGVDYVEGMDEWQWYLEFARGRRWGAQTVRLCAGHHLLASYHRLTEHPMSEVFNRWRGEYRPVVLVGIHLDAVVLRSSVELGYRVERSVGVPGARHGCAWHHAAGMRASPLAVTVTFPRGPEISLTPFISSDTLLLSRFELRYFF